MPVSNKPTPTPKPQFPPALFVLRVLYTAHMIHQATRGQSIDARKQYAADLKARSEKERMLPCDLARPTAPAILADPDFLSSLALAVQLEKRYVK